MSAVGLELVGLGEPEPVRGGEAASVWSHVLPAVAGEEPWALDFFSHLDRVQNYCRRHGIAFREAPGKPIVIPGPEPARLPALLERFEGELFGARAGAPLVTGDPELEIELRRRGVDAYHPAIPRYLFCAVCDFETASLTLLSGKLWAAEVVRRIRPALAELSVEVQIPA